MLNHNIVEWYCKCLSLEIGESATPTTDKRILFVFFVKNNFEKQQQEFNNSLNDFKNQIAKIQKPTESQQSMPSSALFYTKFSYKPKNKFTEMPAQDFKTISKLRT